MILMNQYSASEIFISVDISCLLTPPSLFCSMVIEEMVISLHIDFIFVIYFKETFLSLGARCSSVVRAFAHGVMVCRISPSW